MNRKIIERLKFVMQEHGTTNQDIIKQYPNDPFVGNKANAEKILYLKKHGGELYASDIVKFAKACNCTSDYLLGLSDRMN